MLTGGGVWDPQMREKFFVADVGLAGTASARLFGLAKRKSQLARIKRFRGLCKNCDFGPKMAKIANLPSFKG